MSKEKVVVNNSFWGQKSFEGGIPVSEVWKILPTWIFFPEHSLPVYKNKLIYVCWSCSLQPSTELDY